MAKDQRRNAAAAVAQKARDVRPADAGGHDRDFALALEGLRKGNVPHFDLMGAGVDQCAHFILSFSPDSVASTLLQTIRKRCGTEGSYLLRLILLAQKYEF